MNILFEWLQEDGRDSIYEIEPELSSLAISMDNLDQSNVSINYLTSPLCTLFLVNKFYDIFKPV